MKPLVFHRLYLKETQQVIRWYHEKAGPDRALHFEETLQGALFEIERHPRLSHYDPSGYRRVNLAIYPYHILFEESESETKILLLRHNAQHPDKGLDQI